MHLAVAISLGFLGSFHCVGMCGPIALAIPVKRTSVLSIFSGTMIYNVGRVLTYALMGLLFGILGRGFALAGLQSILSVAIGILILVVLFLPKLKFQFGQGILVRFIGRVKDVFRNLFGKHTFPSLFLIGLLNGLLPCGLVYMGLAGSVTSDSALGGALFMTGFGLGTLPAMFAISVFRERISIRLRERIRKLVPVLVGVMALMLILRGLNLGIPYVSPSIVNSGPIPHHQCCHK